MEKTCGNCGWVTSVNLDCTFAAGDGRYYGRFTRPDAKPCEHWIEAQNTLEQRYQQLAEVARKMFKHLCSVCDGGDVYNEDIADYRNGLEEVGVEV